MSDAPLERYGVIQAPATFQGVREEADRAYPEEVEQALEDLGEEEYLGVVLEVRVRALAGLPPVEEELAATAAERVAYDVFG